MTATQPASDADANSATDTGGSPNPPMPHDEFYEHFVTRNRGLIARDEQTVLRTSTILIAGCGSIGGAAVEPLIRLGAERLILAEPDVYDLHNINRQSMRLQDVGRNKAVVQQERLLDVNPYASIEVATSGITDENVEALVSRSRLVLDGVDVTTQKPLLAKFALHQQAKRHGVPVVAGYDIAGLQMLLVYDYRRPGTRILHGKIRAEEIATIEPMDFLRRIIPIAAIPAEMIPELHRQLRGEREGFPQIIYTALLFGVLACRATLDILAGRPIRRRIIVDTNDLMRPLPTHLAVMLRRWYGLYHLNNEFRRTRGQRRPAARPDLA